MKLILCIHIHPNINGTFGKFLWLLFICKQKELVMVASESVASIIISQPKLPTQLETPFSYRILLLVCSQGSRENKEFSTFNISAFYVHHSVYI